MLTLFFAFLAAAVISMVKLILQLVRRSKASTFNWLPLIILVFQACVVTFANVVPIPDYYRIHAKELNQLVQYVEGQGIKVPEERAITVKIPKQFKEFASREVVASKENGVLKIRVKLTGTHFGNHSFLLYRANGSDPTQKDFLNTKEQKSTFVRKSGKWFLVKWND